MDSSLKPTEQTTSVASDPSYFAADSFPRPPETSLTKAGASEARPERVWLDRMGIVLYVAFCIEVGILLTVLPWYGRIWTDNSIMMLHPRLRALAAENFIRGVVTGLGLVDIWLGISAAIHYREAKRGAPPRPASS